MARPRYQSTSPFLSQSITKLPHLPSLENGNHKHVSEIATQDYKEFIYPGVSCVHLYFSPDDTVQYLYLRGLVRTMKQRGALQCLEKEKIAHSKDPIVVEILIFVVERVVQHYRVSES